jgi:hypothetical protein
MGGGRRRVKRGFFRAERIWGERGGGGPASVSIRQHPSAYVRIRQHTSASVSIRQHTSAGERGGGGLIQDKKMGMRLCQKTLVEYGALHAIELRQHTSACVSIRQHTSAYVSIHPHKNAQSIWPPCNSCKLCSRRQTILRASA